MTEEEVLKMWRNGISKHKIAELYRRRYNQRIRLIRLEVVNRHAGRFISNKEALRYIELIIYRYVMLERRWK